jgi:membrane protease YdiL (CAAX protease family)
VVDRLRLTTWSGLVGALVFVAYAGRAESGKPDEDALYQWENAVGAAVVYGVMLLIVLAIAGFDRRLLALRRPASWGRAAGLSLVVFVVLFVSVAILEQVLHGGEEQGLTPSEWKPEHAWAYAANFVVIALIAPIVEELTFRGLGYSLLEPLGRGVAIALVGLTFGLSHGLVQGLPELVLFGGMLAWLRSATSSVYPGIALHSLFNGIALLAAVLT